MISTINQLIMMLLILYIFYDIKVFSKYMYFNELISWLFAFNTYGKTA